MVILRLREDLCLDLMISQVSIYARDRFIYPPQCAALYLDNTKKKEMVLKALTYKLVSPPPPIFSGLVEHSKI